MKIQNLAVIFIIIVLPISMLLGSYTKNQIKTLNLQNSYDTKLNNATYDALKAFQLNTMNSDTSDLANSKLRDIEASANTFFNSVASNFNMAGFNKDILSNYVPALVYTMYDGYYIYSPYTNILDDTNQNTEGQEHTSDRDILHAGNQEATYKQGDRITGLKPYIYYSCRYKINSDNDFVITYSLDNYITIQGTIQGKWIFDEGYLLDNIEIIGNTIKYREIAIETNETLKETIYYQNSKDTSISPQKAEFEYLKINGVKYYYDNKFKVGKWFSIINGDAYYQDTFNPSTTSAKEYYKKAYDFKQKILNITYRDSNGVTKNDGYGIGGLTADKAVDEKGNPLKDETGNPKFGNYKIFDFKASNVAGKSIEDPNSNFNQQRLAIIRYAIEKNLSIAIANYNNYAGSTTNFQMPKLQENEWDKIVNNVSIISFLQGLNIGGKVYNGYSIITNNKNQEVVKEDSIYMVTKESGNQYQYHKANDEDLLGRSGNDMYGAWSIDFERRNSVDLRTEGMIYVIPQEKEPNGITGCYSSIVGNKGIRTTDNFYEYMANCGNPGLASKYFTALGRERYSMYKTNYNPEKLKSDFGVTY